MASVEDGSYIVQGYWSDGRVSFTASYDDEAEALREAEKLKRSPWFEGDRVRVITRDGELVRAPGKGTKSRARKHEAGKNPLTLGERAKMRLGVLSPAAARSANSREKDLFRSHTGEIQRLAESVEACRRCEHGAEKKALKQLALARKALEGLTKLAKYRSDPDVAEASLKAFRRQIAAAEGILTGKKPDALALRSPPSTPSRSQKGRHPKFGEYEEAQVHESENNPSVARKHPRRREVAVFKAKSPSRAKAAAAQLRKGGHNSYVVGNYGRKTLVVDMTGGRRRPGNPGAVDAALRAKIRSLVGKK